MVWMLIIHALAMSVYYIYHGVLMEDWFSGGHACVLHITYNT